MYDPVLARFLSPDKLLQNPSNTQNYNGYSYVLNNPLKYTDPSGWAYKGYAYFTYKQGFNFETAQNGSAGDLFWDPNPGKGYMVDGMPASKAEYLTAVRSGGEVNIPGLLAELFQVINADGSISVVDTPGEAVDLYNAANHTNKVAFENGGFKYYDVVSDEPPVEAPSYESLSAGGEGAPGGAANLSIDPQDVNSQELINRTDGVIDLNNLFQEIDEFNGPGFIDHQVPYPSFMKYMDEDSGDEYYDLNELQKKILQFKIDYRMIRNQRDTDIDGRPYYVYYYQIPNKKRF
ncbi:MAG TPA: RHS repeat-associated core domain-containing protein, partial [Bacteroidia bacterium]|nr:RHS repeat-associated core domain-containing protein [Bacteroidia bacterium]